MSPKSFKRNGINLKTKHVVLLLTFIHVEKVFLSFEHPFNILNEMIVTSLQSHSINSRSIDVFKYVFFQLVVT